MQHIINILLAVIASAGVALAQPAQHPQETFEMTAQDFQPLVATIQEAPWKYAAPIFEQLNKIVAEGRLRKQKAQQPEPSTKN